LLDISHMIKKCSVQLSSLVYTFNLILWRISRAVRIDRLFHLCVFFMTWAYGIYNRIVCQCLDGRQDYRQGKLRGYDCKCTAARRDTNSGELGCHSPASWRPLSSLPPQSTDAASCGPRLKQSGVARLCAHRHTSDAERVGLR
jgi:hypothetical protein